MKNFTVCTLLALVLGLFASQASAVSLTFETYPEDTIFALPGQAVGGQTFVRTDSLDQAMFLSLLYNFSTIGFNAQIWSGLPYGCGVSESWFTSYEPGNQYRLYWQDYGNLCGADAFHLNTYYFVNHIPTESTGLISSGAQATVASVDTVNFWTEVVSGGYTQVVYSYDAIRGDVSGAMENDSAFSWRDIQIADSFFRHEEDMADIYRRLGTNVMRGASYWSWPTPGDVSFMALAMNQPNHPYVRNIHYGEPFSTPRPGIMSVPASADLSGSTVYVSTNGSMAMAMAILPDGSIWVQSGPTQNGVATFYDVPDGITQDMIVVEAVSLDGVTEIDPYELPALPSQVELGQNYPNPFNPQTTVPFTLQVPARVSLTVYDQLGRQVAKLADGPYQAGRHEVSFNASNLPSGMYFAQLKAGHATSTKKMLLLK